MKATTTALALSLFALLISCEKSQDPSTERPSIESVSFVGIPDENVELDHRLSRIIVQTPMELPPEGLKPTFKLSRNTEILQGVTADGLLIAPVPCGCRSLDENFNKYNAGVVKVANDNKVGPYQSTRAYSILVLPNKGCPKPIDNLPIKYVRSDQNGRSMILIYLPVSNLYTNPCVSHIILKNLETGERQGNSSFLSYYLNGCDYRFTNHMRIQYEINQRTKLIPGSYEVSIEMGCDGGKNTLVFSQPLIYKE